MSNSGNAAGPVLVTGASGFVGSHLTAQLCAEGRAVRTFRHEQGAGLQDLPAVCSAMRDVDTVFHLGGIASAGAATINPHATFQVNAAGTLNVLEAARKANVSRMVVLSTAHVYGIPTALPVTEETPCAPASIYAATKLAGDCMALAYYSSFSFPVTVLRAFNVYGPGQKCEAVIPRIVVQAMAGGPISVRSVTPRRDFIYVSDIVGALLIAETAPDAMGQVFILASGRAVSIAELVSRVASLTELGGKYSLDEPAPGPDCVFGSSAKAGDVLGWKPAVSLHDGLTRTIEWWKDQPSQAGAIFRA